MALMNSSRFRAARCTPSIPKASSSAISPTATVATCCGSAECASSYRRNSRALAGSSSCSSMTRRALRSGSSCTTAAVARISAAQSTAKSQLDLANFGRIAENQPPLHKEINHGGGSLREDKSCHQRVGGTPVQGVIEKWECPPVNHDIDGISKSIGQRHHGKTPLGWLGAKSPPAI